MMSMPGGGHAWLAYVGVEDIQAATEKVRTLGAHVMMGPQEIPSIGWMTVMRDPTGCTIAIFQPTPGGAVDPAARR